MSYTQEFHNRIVQRDITRVLALWKEFCEIDALEEGELTDVLKILASSDNASSFGPYMELALPLVMSIKDQKEQMDAFCLLFDLQTTNSQSLWDLLQKIVKENFGSDPLFNEKLRITGIRTKGNFQGALSHFLLLNHCQKSNFVYHKSGWGVGEIVDSSILREQISVEFENVPGSKKDLPFKTAFKSLTSLPKDHVLALRFKAPEVLEEQANKDPVGLVTKIIEELGPKTASEIKDLLAGYVFDESRYSKWWQLARGKLKKDPLIISPETLKEPFDIRKQKLTLASRVNDLFTEPVAVQTIVPALWSLLKDFPQVVKETITQNKISSEIELLLKNSSLRSYEKIELFFLSELIDGQGLHEEELKKEITSLEKPIEEAVKIEIIAFRKRFLQAIQAYRPDWEELFKIALLEIEPAQIKEYVYKELITNKCLKTAKEVFETLLTQPAIYPEAFLWAFQKVIEKESDIFTEQRDQERFFESFLILLSLVETKSNKKEFAKKMHSLLTGHRFKIVREFFKYADISFVQEFLLLASKCQTISEHDVKILQSLAEVAFPDLSEKKETKDDSHILWTTEAGYRATEERIKHIGTVEIVDNAKEIEAARALGDLRENAEFKAALERRSRLQSELKRLSDQFHRARIITKGDIDPSAVGVGTKVVLQDQHGKKQEYAILGPWDANVEKNILSYQSKFAEAMLKKQIGDKLSFRGETFVVTSITSYFS